MAQRVRQEFVFAMQQWTARRLGRPSDYGVRPMRRWDATAWSDSFWMKVAKACIARSMHPRRLISTMFTNWNTSRTPTPNMLMASSVWERAADGLQDDTHSMRKELDRQLAHMRHEARTRVSMYAMTEDAAVLCVLRNPTEPLSALFRYCVAVEIGNKTIADFYYRDASLQYVMDAVVYDTAWSRVLPAGFSEQAHVTWKLPRGV